MTTSKTIITPISKDRLIRRLKYLCYGELINVFAVPYGFWLVAQSYGEVPGIISILAATLVSMFLLQGVAYWWLKLTATQTDSEIPLDKIRWFRPIRTLNWLLLAAWLCFGLFTGPHATFEWTAGLILWTMALLEQVNYFYYQLMYDFSADWRRLLKTKRLRVSSLSKQLRRL